jgi:hypothetical protein
MGHGTFRTVLVFSLIAVLAATAAAQRRQPGGTGGVPMDVTLKVGSGTYASQAVGACTHAPKASIYGIVSQMWTARQQVEGRSLSLTLWRPADGSGDMFTLAVNDYSAVSITTVRGGTPSGSGSVKLEPQGRGGTFHVSAKGKGGEAVTGTIRCETFMPHVAEGG